MTHRIEINVQTGETTQVEYTAEEQAAYDAAVVAQAELDAQQAEATTPVQISVEPT
jgi:hypothetical protein